MSSVRNVAHVAVAAFVVTHAVQAQNTVTCRLTIDNAIMKIWYNGREVLPSAVSGNWRNWAQPKTWTFTDAPGGGVIEIFGEEFSGGCDIGCRASGLLMTCTAPSGTCWDGYVSTSNAESTRTWGSCTSFARTDLPPVDQLRDACTSTSGFRMSGSGSAEKIWSSSAQNRFAYFRLTSPKCPPTPAPTQQPTMSPTLMPTTQTTTTTSTRTTHTAIPDIHRQLGRLLDVNDRQSDDITSLLAQVSALQATQRELLANMSALQATTSSLQNTVKTLQDGISAAKLTLPSIPAITSGPDCIMNPSDSGCEAPSIRITDDGDLRLTAQQSTVLLNTAECGLLNPCETLTTLQAVVTALNKLQSTP